MSEQPKLTPGTMVFGCHVCRWYAGLTDPTMCDNHLYLDDVDRGKCEKCGGKLTWYGVPLEGVRHAGSPDAK